MAISGNRSWLVRGAILAALAVPATAQQGAYFVLEGGGNPLTIERLDPVINPGVASGHVHSVVGGNSFKATMDYAETQKATCSSFSPKADLSVYWNPNLYFHDPRNGSFIRVPEQPFHKIYYKYGQGDNTYMRDIQEFPKEFRMIAGDPLARSLNATGMGPYGSSLGWSCHGGNGYPDLNTVGIPKGFRGCPNGLAAAVTFPSCWNGKDFNLADPYAHVAYPVADGILGCPPTHRVRRFPQIFMEYWLNIQTFNGLYNENDSPFVLSNGDPTGYAFHADFINGWKEGVLNAIFPTCKPGNTGNPPLSDNSCFGPHGGTFTLKEMNECAIKPVINEPVGWNYGDIDNPQGGVLTYGREVNKLPGCNPIQYGPDRAKPQTCGNDPPPPPGPTKAC